MAQINQLYADMKSQINNLFSQNSEITVIEFWDVIYASKYLHLIIKSIGFKYNLQTEEILHELYILGLSTNLFSTILKRRVYNNKFLIYELLRIARKLVRINHNHVNIDDENIQNEMSSSPDLGLDDEIIRSAEVQEINNKVAILQTQQIMNLSSRIAHLSSLSGYWLKLELNIPDEKFILMRKKLTNKDIITKYTMLYSELFYKTNAIKELLLDKFIDIKNVYRNSNEVNSMTYKTFRLLWNNANLWLINDLRFLLDK